MKKVLLYLTLMILLFGIVSAGIIGSMSIVDTFTKEKDIIEISTIDICLKENQIASLDSEMIKYCNKDTNEKVIIPEGYIKIEENKEGVIKIYLD